MAARKPTPDPAPTQPADDTPVDVATGELIEDADVVVDTGEDLDEAGDEMIAEPADDTGDAVEAVVDDPHPVTAPRHGVSILPTSSDPREWTNEQKALLDAAGLVSRKGGQVITAPRATIAAFLSQCHRTGLDPIARQIYCVERAGKWTIQISIDGFRLIAERTGGYRGQTAPQWTGDGVTWVDVWLQKTPPAAARVGVHRDGFKEPAWGIATYEGYCPRDRNGNLDPKNQWKTNPSNQLAKCAEMQGLRKGFPQELSGLYGSEEMDQADRPAAPAVTPRQDLRAIHAAGVDEHKLPDQAPADTTVVRDDGDQGSTDLTPLERWKAWKAHIDTADTVIKLVKLRTEMARMLELPIPEDPEGRTVAAYFDYRRAQLTGQTGQGAAARLQQGLHQDLPVGIDHDLRQAIKAAAGPSNHQMAQENS
jgi:phage recombination protein Bet